MTGTGVVGLSLYEFGTDRGVGSWNVMVLEQEPVVYNNQPCVSWYPYFQVYNNPPCVSWSAYFQVLSPSNNSIHTSRGLVYIDIPLPTIRCIKIISTLTPADHNHHM